MSEARSRAIWWPAFRLHCKFLLWETSENCFGKHRKIVLTASRPALEQSNWATAIGRPQGRRVLATGDFSSHKDEVVLWGAKANPDARSCERTFRTRGSAELLGTGFRCER
jgi:hypothetical protein